MKIRVVPVIQGLPVGEEVEMEVSSLPDSFQVQTDENLIYFDVGSIFRPATEEEQAQGFIWIPESDK